MTKKSWKLTTEFRKPWLDLGRLVSDCNKKYGLNNWRLVWLTAENSFSASDVFWQIYIPAYVRYFSWHLKEAILLSQKYACVLGGSMRDKKMALNLGVLKNKNFPVNKYYALAINIAIERFLGFQFSGKKAVIIEENEPKSVSVGLRTDRWLPRHIPIVRNDMLKPKEKSAGKISIEDFYRSNSALQVKVWT